MASRTSLDPTIAPAPTPSSPRSPGLPQIGSLAVTGVVESATLQGSPRSSSQAMQDLQRQQTRPAAAAVLSPARVNPSVADDMDDLLNETLKEFAASLPAASPSSVQPSAAASLSSSLNKLSFPRVEEMLATVIGFQFVELMHTFNSQEMNENTSRTGELLSTSISSINLFFKSLIAQSANLEAWLEGESQTQFLCNTHPFGASCLLLAHLHKAGPLLEQINPTLLAEWKDNYQQCVLILKRRGLDRYNETEFPFTEQHKPMISMVPILGELLKNPQVADMVRQQMASFAQDPEAVLSAMQAENPQAAELLRAQMEGLGSDPASLEAMIKPQVLPVIAFFQELNLVLQRHPTDARAVEAWLKVEAAKSTYPHPFFMSKDMIGRNTFAGLSETRSVTELKVLYTSLCERLAALGLQRCLDEAPPKHIMDLLRQTAISQKETLQEVLFKGLSVLRPLSAELKKLNLAPEARDANRQTIEGWITTCKAARTYFAPFVVCQDLCQYLSAFEGILDGEQLRELNVLLPFCREQLLALGLNTYIEEMPSYEQLSPAATTTAAPAAAAASAPKKSLSDTERFKREIAFFRDMIKQDDKTLAQWLKDNSPKLDYPLLWAKKRMYQLSQFKDTVDFGLRGDWIMCAEACLEKIESPALRHLMDITNIPADASPELRAYLA